jgi:3-oxoacyl-[acyl-carrier protein] reductase
MQIDLSGKVALITGAGRGIGREIARVFAAEGMTVCIVDVQQVLLDDVAAEWEKNGWRGLQTIADVTNPAACKAAIEAVTTAFGRLDILVNNAGVASGGPVETLSEEIWDRNLDINLKGTFLMSQAAIPVMKAQQSGRILNAASFAAIVPFLEGAAYAASKFGVEGFTRVLAGELGPWNITVNCYAPGMIPTEMNKYAEQPPERQKELLDTLTLRRWGSATDVANLLCFLSSDQGAYITGTMIDISGGKFATQMPHRAYLGL